MKYCLIILLAAILSPSFAQTGSDRSSRKLLLRDEGLSKLSYIDLANPKANWFVAVPVGRDIQLVGKGRVLAGTGNGYEEREISTGAKVAELTTFPGTQTAHRLRNGNTLLAGANWQGEQGIVLVEVDAAGSIKRKMIYPGFSYVRLIRETTSGTFMVTADDTVFEGDASGNIIWKAKIVGREKPHIWQAQRLANGQILVSTGYAANFQVFAKDGSLVSTFTGTPEVKPEFFSGFQVLANGNYVVANWQGHGPNYGASGHQLLEFTPKGEQVWSWKQDAANFSSLQGVLVLDGLDTRFLHVEDGNGVLVPVK